MTSPSLSGCLLAPPGGQGDPEARHAELLVGEPRGTDAKSEKSKITKTMDTAAHGWRHP